MTDDSRIEFLKSLMNAFDALKPTPIRLRDEEGHIWRGLIKTPKGTEVYIQTRIEKRRFRRRRMFMHLYDKETEELIETVELQRSGGRV